MRLLLGQLYDMQTSRQLEKLCVGEVLMPHIRLHPGAFRQAVTHLLYKFPVLRASFIRRHNELTMRFSAPDVVNVDDVFQVRPAQHETAALREQLRNYISDVRSGMSLERPPLLRYCLFDDARADGQRLVLIFNHLVCDGISSRILWRELSHAYKRAMSGEPLVFESCTSYPDFAEALFLKHRQLAQRPDALAAIEPVRGYLDRLTQGLGCSATLAEVVRKEHPISGEALSALRDRAAGLGVGLSDLLLTCWLHALTQLQNEGVITLLMWVSPHFVGEWSTPVDELVGSVSFPLPVTFSLSGRRPFAEAVKRVGEELEIGLAGAEVFAARYFANGTLNAVPPLPSIGFNFVSDMRPGPSLIGYELAPEGIGIERLEQEPYDLALGLEIEIYGREMQITVCATPYLYQRLPVNALFDGLIGLLM